MWPNPHVTADLVTFTEEIVNGKLHFCAGCYRKKKMMRLWNIPILTMNRDELRRASGIYISEWLFILVILYFYIAFQNNA